MLCAVPMRCIATSNLFALIWRDEVTVNNAYGSAFYLAGLHLFPRHRRLYIVCTFTTQQLALYCTNKQQQPLVRSICGQQAGIHHEYNILSPQNRKR